jgi:hypothetical protein
MHQDAGIAGDYGRDQMERNRNTPEEDLGLVTAIVE